MMRRCVIDFLEHEQLEELRRIVHQLKGSGGGYGFSAITHEAAKAEQVLRSSPQLQEVETVVRSLADLVRRVEGYQASLEESETCHKNC
jgi:HPt (histidine-containing phosphotransfer) domain-containing protein